MNHQRLSDLADRFASTIKKADWRHAAKLGALLTMYADAEVQDQEAGMTLADAEAALETFVREPPPE